MMESPITLVETSLFPLEKISFVLKPSSKIFWKILKINGLIVPISEPDAHKIFINEIFEIFKNDISSKKFDLIFYHILFPHKPYGLNKKCAYDVKLSHFNNSLNQKSHIKRHNIERICTIKILEKFFSKLNDVEKIKIIILSDHGSKISNSKSSSLSTILAFKNFNSNNSSLVNDEVVLQKVFKNIINLSKD